MKRSFGSQILCDKTRSCSLGAQDWEEPECLSQHQPGEPDGGSRPVACEGQMPISCELPPGTDQGAQKTPRLRMLCSVAQLGHRAPTMCQAQRASPVLSLPPTSPSRAPSQAPPGPHISSLDSVPGDRPPCLAPRCSQGTFPDHTSTCPPAWALGLAV